MNPGQAYAIQGGNNTTETINFEGTFNNGLINVPGTVDVFAGNPYPSPIRAVDVINAGAGTVYFWTHDSNLVSEDPNGNITWAGDDYISCTLAMCTGGHSGKIGVGQGFFTDGGITFNNAMRLTEAGDFRSASHTEKLWLDLNSDFGFKKQIGITFTDNGTLGYDQNYDAKTFSTNYGLGFYSINNTNDKLTINDVGIFTDEIVIPLGYYINSEDVKNTIISINNSENLEDATIYLKDNLLNTLHNLKESNYTIPVTETGEFNNRFEIIISRNVVSVDQLTLSDRLIITNQSENEIAVKMLDGSIVSELVAFDILGKLILDVIPNASDFVLETNYKKGQILIIKVTLENGQTINKKFIKL
jgi:hypothetical protein